MPHNGLRRQIAAFMQSPYTFDHPMQHALALLTRALDVLGGPVQERRPEPVPAPTPEVASEPELEDAHTALHVPPPVDEPQPVVDSDTYIVNDDQRAMLVGTLPE